MGIANDCSAFVTALCFAQQPGKFIFDQIRMRQHLMHCLEMGHFTMFPIKSERRGCGIKSKNLEYVSVFCQCRMPDVPNQPDMISCSNCGEWFHANSCVTDILECAWKLQTRWTCQKCNACFV